MSTVIIIPARLAASRLPNKPILPIQGIPMIARVFQQVSKADLGAVYVACDSTEIANIIHDLGGKVCLTDAALPSGSDRVFAALSTLHERFDYVINVQGDMPFIEPSHIVKAYEALTSCTDFDMATLASPIHDEREWSWPQVVKVIAEERPDGLKEAQDFVRTAPLDHHEVYHHIGIYAYKRQALERFIQAPQSPKEKERKLEQMRALDLGMRIGLAIVDDAPLAVDTPEDYERAQNYLV